MSHSLIVLCKLLQSLLCLVNILSVSQSLQLCDNLTLALEILLLFVTLS